MRITITKEERMAICYKLNMVLKNREGLTTKGDVYTQRVLEKLKCYQN